MDTDTKTLEELDREMDELEAMEDDIPAWKIISRMRAIQKSAIKKLDLIEKKQDRILENTNRLLEEMDLLKKMH